MSLTSYFMEATYLVASILFVLALKGMSHPETARRGCSWPRAECSPLLSAH